ncbi:unnamed protein product [Periconia digitata]|uniref:Uncharacterized protein n=1 Tax=Periconia digitata TaxID=1303443 RepID=A0A9W4UAR1_9PLEO|nr:unnamed protein product [Periconia digitata]
MSMFHPSHPPPVANYSRHTKRAPKGTWHDRIRSRRCSECVGVMMGTLPPWAHPQPINSHCHSMFQTCLAAEAPPAHRRSGAGTRCDDGHSRILSSSSPGVEVRQSFGRSVGFDDCPLPPLRTPTTAEGWPLAGCLHRQAEQSASVGGTQRQARKPRPF